MGFSILQTFLLSNMHLKALMHHTNLHRYEVLNHKQTPLFTINHPHPLALFHPPSNFRRIVNLNDTRTNMTRMKMKTTSLHHPYPPLRNSPKLTHQ
jgi:hypothetical protein